jgi:hypothetical protein
MQNSVIEIFINILCFVTQQFFNNPGLTSAQSIGLMTLITARGRECLSLSLLYLYHLWSPLGQRVCCDLQIACENIFPH